MTTTSIETGVFAEVERTWDSRETMLYAVGVGAGARSLGCDLEWATENSENVAQRVIPTFGLALVGGEKELLDREGLSENNALLMSESITLAGDLPISGTMRIVKQVTEVSEHRLGLRVELIAEGSDSHTRRSLFTTRSSLLLRMPREEATQNSARALLKPQDAVADAAIERTVYIPENLALIYRLSAGRNPLHSDPGAARRAGYRMPILHGRCTFGFCAREIINAFAEAPRSTRLAEISGQFVAPVWPGETFVLRIGYADGACEGRYDLVRPGSGRPVIANGYFSLV